MKPRIRLELSDSLPPMCRVKRGPRAYTICELPPNHSGQHLGRSFSGRWFSWL